MAELSPNLGLNLPVGSDRFDYDKFLRQNFQILDDKVGKSTIEVITATEGQTVFTLANPYALGTDSLSVEVDGVKQLIGSGYTETSTTSITLSEPLVAGAKVKVVILGLDQGQDNRFDQIESSLAESAKKLDGVVSMLDFDHLKVAVSGGYDYAPALQAAIDSIAPDPTNGYYYADSAMGAQPNSSKRGGTVLIPSGSFRISNVVLKSHVSIKGDGQFSTRIIPIATSGYVFSSNAGVKTPTFLGLVGVNLEDFIIAPTWNTYGNEATKPTCGGIYLRDCYRDTNIKNVGVYNLNGDAFTFEDVFDANFESLTAMFNNVGFYLKSNTNEVTNAIKLFGCRSESNKNLLIEDNATGSQIRQNQYIGCKFEQNTDYPTETAIKLKGTCSPTFSSCMFVPNNPSVYMIKCDSTGATADNRNVIFNGCSFAASQAHSNSLVLQAVATLGVMVTGCTFNGLSANSLTGNIVVTGSTFTDCQAPIFGTGVKIGTSNRFAATYDPNLANNSDLYGDYHKFGTTIFGDIVSNIQTTGTTITFPRAFPNGIVSVIATTRDSGAAYKIEVSAATKTGFTLKSEVNGANAYYIAIGY